MCKAPVIYIGNGRGGAPQKKREKKGKKMCGGGKYTSLYWQTERKRGAREEGET